MSYESAFCRSLRILKYKRYNQIAPGAVIQHGYSKGIWHRATRRTSFTLQKRWQSVDASLDGSISSTERRILDLPHSCPGCGAPSQQTYPERAGFFSLQRKAVKQFFRELDGVTKSLDSTASGSLPYSSNAPEAEISNLANGSQNSSAPFSQNNLNAPFCDRCHELLYQSRGVSIAHPSIESIAETIDLSPFRKNHVYHVIDAADFPLSVIPSIFKHLSLMRLRSQNRRARDPRYRSREQNATLSFVITRSDLLAPKKEQVDSMMPYFIDILRDMLGRHGQGARLGNVHLVSAKRGWWTVHLKEQLRKRGGANWMVGKVNVGKSNLLEVLLPKGMSGHSASAIADLMEDAKDDEIQDMVSAKLSPLMLPPTQPFSPTPTLPLVSALPGTTASPIRLPFFSEGSSSSRSSELIDMPGLERGALAAYVLSDHQKDLVMTSRPTPSQHVIKNGQSLLLGGGMIRITPIAEEQPHDGELSSTLEAPDTIIRPKPQVDIIAHPFLPAALGAHITNNEKAIAAQLQESSIPRVENVLTPDASGSVRSAGVFKLNTDITKQSTGSMLRAGVKLQDLFFKVYSTDILIEGVGWVELSASVRRNSHHGYEVDSHLPQVEIFSPEGRCVAQRPSLGLWARLEADLPKNIKDRRRHAKIRRSARIVKKRSQRR
ncbi:MAG: hypothetical protein Q9227_001009 [Pyrenula ochraceoflavens]